MRLKPPSGIGGQGQRVVTHTDQLAALYASPAERERLASEGLVLEEDLTAVVTRSVGQVWLDGIRMSYVGVQRSTRDNHGAPVYGGSELWCVRGGFDALDQLDTDANARLAIRQARTYHEAALRCFAGIILSRANYDVAQGIDAQGHWRSGVLEQSWRAGGPAGPAPPSSRPSPSCSSNRSGKPCTCARWSDTARRWRRPARSCCSMAAIRETAPCSNTPK